MCFTPLASILTALLEFFIAGYLWHRISFKRLRMIPFFISLLGAYQLTEFLLCTTSYTVFWARLGFVFYTFMPMVLLHLFFNISRIRLPKSLYLVPSFYATFALFYPGFIIRSSCEFLHVDVESLVFNANPYLMWTYLFYYAAFPVYGFYRYMEWQKEFTMTNSLKLGLSFIPLAIILSQIFFLFAAINGIDPELTWVGISVLLICISVAVIILASIPFIKHWHAFSRELLFGLMSSSVTLTILFAVIPGFDFAISSIFCQFAIFYSIVAIVLVEILQKKLKKEKKR